MRYATLARVQAQLGQKDEARRNYQKLFEMWKDADPDLPLLVQAREEFVKARARILAGAFCPSGISVTYFLARQHFLVILARPLEDLRRSVDVDRRRRQRLGGDHHALLADARARARDYLPAMPGRAVAVGRGGQLPDREEPGEIADVGGVQSLVRRSRGQRLNAL